MRILVLGRSGQLARAIVARGSVAGHSMTALGRSEADLCSPASVRTAVASARPNIVINAAAYTAVDRAETEQDLAHALNVTGPAAAAAAAHQLGIPFIHVSTDYVFDGLKGRPYVETDAPAPVNVYGATKAEGEAAVAEANPRRVVLRTSWVYSATGSNFVLTMLRLAEGRDVLRVVNDQTGCPTHADELAEAILRISDRVVGCEIGDPAFGLFHCAAAGETTWHGFAEAIMKGSQARGGPWCGIQPIPTASYPTPARRPVDTRLDCARLARVHEIGLPEWRISLSKCLDQISGLGPQEWNS